MTACVSIWPPFLLMGLVALWGCQPASSSQSPEAPATSRPNIVLITVDDLGWTDAACLGSDFYETPHIDRLASQGMTFTQAYANAALCSPTRASIMTGRYPARLGITDWIRARFQPGGKAEDRPADGGNPSGYEASGGADAPYLTPQNPFFMELEEQTLAEVLQEAGYRTGHIGKWHLGDTGYEPQDQGFELNVGGCDFGEPPSYFDPYNRAPMEEYGYDTIPLIPHLPPRTPGEYLTYREAQEAQTFIRQHRHEPFFLNYCPYAVHVPLQAPDSLTERFANLPPGKRHQHATYAAMVYAVDQAVGQLLQLLDELGLSEQTLVIFTSDNGGLIANQTTSNYPLRAGKAFPYEGGLRIPLIMRWPGMIGHGVDSSSVVATMDYLPTLCEAAAVPLPASLVIDGESFWPAVTQQAWQPERDALVWHYPHYRKWDQMVPWNAIRKGRYKLIRKYDQSHTYELFDLYADLGETTDISSAHPELVKELVAEMDEILEEVGARLPKPTPTEQAQ